MNILKYLLIIIPIISFSQSEEIIDHLSINKEIEQINFLNTHKNYDFSKVFLHKNNPVGIIGKTHQMIDIKFLSIKKDINKQNEYIVYGKSKVKNNICEFRGTIIIKKILKMKEFTYGVDDWYKGKIKEQGILIADYFFTENKYERGTGVFKGKLYSKWCIFNKTKNIVSYDNIEDNSDSYTNNVFVGKWKSYRTKKEKICNWGDFRVPLANSDFDIGAAEFSPNEKYKKYGWGKLNSNDKWWVE